MRDADRSMVMNPALEVSVVPEKGEQLVGAPDCFFRNPLADTAKCIGIRHQLLLIEKKQPE